MSKIYAGISCTGHDNAIALVDQQGEVLFAQSADRIFRKKQVTNTAADDYSLVKGLLEEYAQGVEEITVCKSWSKNTRSLWEAENKAIEASIYSANRGYQNILRSVLFQHNYTLEAMILPNIAMAGNGLSRAAAEIGIAVSSVNFEHHDTHAAFGCYTSPFEEAACLVVDGVGENDSHKLFEFESNLLRACDKNPYSGKYSQHVASLGIFYGLTACLVCGFDTLAGEEWKIMGLAPYGKLNPEVHSILQRHIGASNGQLVLPAKTEEAFVELIGYRKTYEEDPKACADLAYTVQYHFSEVMLHIIDHAHQLTGQENLVLAGGCALNSSFNGRILSASKFKNLYVPSAPADDGNCIGAAFLGLKESSPNMRLNRSHQTPYLGDEICVKEVERLISNTNVETSKRVEYKQLYKKVARELAAGKIVAWVQGRAEFGPRALGNRSILGDPRSAHMKARINNAVKYRESFRPFAPSILHDYGDEYFEDYHDTPYMEKTLIFREFVRSSVEAVCHEDYTGRVQSVTKERNLHYYNLITAFHEITGVPMVLNTSLNVMGKPIVSCAEDVYVTFMNSDIDILIVDNLLVEKKCEKENKIEYQSVEALV